MNSQTNKQWMAFGVFLATLSICPGMDAMLAKNYEPGAFMLLGLLGAGIIFIFAACKNRGRGNPAPFSELVVGNGYEVIHFQPDISGILILNRSGRCPEGEPLLISDRGFPPVLKVIGRRFEKTEQSHKIIC